MARSSAKRYYPFLATLAAQEHLRPRLIEVEIAEIDTKRLGNTRAGSPEKEQQASITSSAWRLLIRRVEEGIEFLSGHMMRHLGVRLLRWDREDRCATPSEAGSFAATWWKNDRIAASRALRVCMVFFRFCLKVIEEGEDKIPIEIGDRQCAGLALRAFSGEQDQQAQGVTIAGDGRAARIALLHHAMAEEGFQ